MSGPGAVSAYFISTPYIDAYKNGPDAIIFGDFIYLMQNQSLEWGEMGVGRAVIYGHELPAHEGRLVFAFGEWGTKKYVALCGEGDKKWSVDVAEVTGIPSEWNVT